MFMDKPYMVFAQALSDSLLLHISKTVIMDELERDPKLGRKMIASLSMRLHHLITDVESYSLHSGRQRIIGYLLRDNMESDAQSTDRHPAHQQRRHRLTPQPHAGTLLAHPARTCRRTG
jgi:CRP-like cAMP-binding protein